METILLAIGFFGVIFALFAVRIIFKKDGEFRGTCSTQRQTLQDVYGIDCPVCGKAADEPCQNPESADKKEVLKSEA